MNKLLTKNKFLVKFTNKIYQRKIGCIQLNFIKSFFIFLRFKKYGIKMYIIHFYRYEFKMGKK